MLSIALIELGRELIYQSLKEEYKVPNLCLAGGVALNCVANGKLLQGKIFDHIWIQPASGDAGSALGAALVGWHQHKQQKRVVNVNDSMKGTYLGPEFSNDDITNYLEQIKAPFHTHSCLLYTSPSPRD